jgi:hypothetical protein
MLREGTAEGLDLRTFGVGAAGGNGGGATSSSSSEEEYQDSLRSEGGGFLVTRGGDFCFEYVTSREKVSPRCVNEIDFCCIG